MARSLKRATSSSCCGRRRRRQQRCSEPLPSHAGARLAARSALAVALVAGSLWVAAEFLPALIWPESSQSRLGPCTSAFPHSFPMGMPLPFAALVFTLAVGLTIFLPLALATYQIAQQSGFLLGWIESAREQGIPVPEWAVQLPIAASAITEWWRENLSDPKMAATWLETFNAENSAGWIRTMGGQLVQRSFMFFVSLIALFVMLRHGSWITQACTGHGRSDFWGPRREARKQDGFGDARDNEWHNCRRSRGRPTDWNRLWCRRRSQCCAVHVSYHRIRDVALRSLGSIYCGSRYAFGRRRQFLGCRCCFWMGRGDHADWRPFCLAGIGWRRRSIALSVCARWRLWRPGIVRPCWSLSLDRS